MKQGVQGAYALVWEGKQGVQGAYALVQAHRTSSNLLEPQHHRDSKVWRDLSHEFGVVRLY